MSSNAFSSQQRQWEAAAIAKIEADFNRSADTHLIPPALPGYPDIDVYLKDESSRPTGVPSTCRRSVVGRFRRQVRSS